MKILKPRYDLILFFFPTFLIIAILAYSFFFQLLLNMSTINWFLDLVLLILLLLPMSSKKLGEQKFIESNFKWCALIFISQLLINSLFWGLNHFIYSHHALPSSPPGIHLIPYVFSSGMYPFGFLGLLILTMGYFTYIQKKPGLLSSAFTPLFGNNNLDSIGIAVDTYMRLITYYCLIFCLGMLCIHFMYLIHIGTGWNFPYGLNFKMMLVSCTLLLLISNQYIVKFLHQLQYRRFPTVIILLLFVTALSVIYLVLGSASSILDRVNPTLNEFYLVLDTRFLNNHLNIILTFTWLGFAALLGGVITVISRGHRLRTTIIVCFIFNLLSWGILFSVEKVARVFSTLPALVDVVCLLIGVIFMLKNKNVTFFMRACLPSDVPIKPRSTFYLVKVLPFVIVSFVCTYLTMGIYFLSLSAVLIFLPCYVMILISYIGLMRANFQFK